MTAQPTTDDGREIPNDPAFDSEAWPVEPMRSRALEAIRTAPEPISTYGLHRVLGLHGDRIFGVLDLLREGDLIRSVGSEYAGGYLWAINETPDHEHDWEYVDPQPEGVGFPEEEQHQCKCGVTRWFS